MNPDVVTFPDSYRKPAVADAWKESLRRIARAQAILWSRTPITERQALLAEVDQEAERLQK